MKNKIVGIILMSAMAFQLVACESAATANAEGVTVEAVSETQNAESQATESQATDTQAAESKESEAAETKAEEVRAATETPAETNQENAAEGQASDFAGQYYAGKGNLSITDKGNGNYFIEVWWPSDAATHGEWAMNAKYDEASKTLTYSDCTKHEYTLKDNGEVDTDETVYTDGTGSIKIVDANTIMWNDDQEHVADEVEMTR